MTFTRSTSWLSIVALCVASAACAPKDGGERAQETSASVAAAAPPAPQPTAARAPAVAITVGDGDLAANPIGVPACDAYVAAINACYVPKLPPEARDEVLAPMKQLRFAWKERADGATEAVKKALAAECDAALVAEKTRLEAARCMP
jgi:hypothetical protein